MSKLLIALVSSLFTTFVGIFVLSLIFPKSN